MASLPSWGPWSAPSPTPPLRPSRPSSWAGWSGDPYDRPHPLPRRAGRRSEQGHLPIGGGRPFGHGAVRGRARGPRLDTAGAGPPARRRRPPPHDRGRCPTPRGLHRLALSARPPASLHGQARAGAALLRPGGSIATSASGRAISGGHRHHFELDRLYPIRYKTDVGLLLREWRNRRKLSLHQLADN